MSIAITRDVPAPPVGDSAEGDKVARVTQRIREMILKDELQPGRPIRERSLAETLGVSRTPTREALKVLASEGLVDLSPNRGAFVAVVDREEVFQIVEVLAEMEAFASRLACRFVTEEELGELWALHYEMLAFRARNVRLGYFENNQAIHLGIVRAARNRTLIEHHRILNARVYRLRFVAHQAASSWDTAIREHEEILRRLDARDEAALSDLVRIHVSSIWTRLSGILAEDGTLTERLHVSA